MTFESVLRTDILPDELTEIQKKVKVISETQYLRIVSNAEKIEKTRTPKPAKNIIEVMELIRQAFIDYDRRTHATGDAQVRITYENPDIDMETETVSILLDKREPGMYGQGRPFENKIRALRPLLREEVEDTDNPGYKRAILGYFYDNVLSLTCWAKTNKAANQRALWLENVMEEYAWFFTYSGVNRILYHGRGDEKVREVENNRIYGRPIDYFVRTEKIRVVSQKELEQIYVNMAKITNIR